MDELDLGPFARVLGLRVTSATLDEVRAEWAVTEALLQPFGLLNGGAHCAVVETMAGVAASVWLGQLASTSGTPAAHAVGVHNATNFFRPSRLGDALTSVARPVHQGRSQQLIRVETFDASGRLVAAGEVRIHNVF